MVSSGATIPARAPASIDMLQMVILPSMDSSSIADPRYSRTYPCPPPVPIFAMTARMMSLAVTPGFRCPSTVIAMVLNGARDSVWVAITCSTSLVPMPKARAPKAPWVEVCESPHTTVMPGWVSPSWGPTTCTMPCSASPREWMRTPNSAALARSVSICWREVWSAMRRKMSWVGVLWSSVAMVRSGRRRRRPARRSPSKACGEVTSWSRCRSM
ncbi:Uncharacterised protein [Mycobacteroides abscessus subsp. abscessus]|nr:Uncharacterised protein [Mycobacteroides abscessus subsp. abscessus]